MVDRIDSKSTVQRDLSIDMMKGVAIFFMIAGHVLTIPPIAKSFGLSTALLSRYCPFQLPFAFFQGCAALVYLWIGWLLRGRSIPTSGKICLTLVWLLYFPYNGVGMVYNTYNMYPLDVLSAVGGGMC